MNDSTQLSISASIVAYRNDPAQLQTAIRSFLSFKGFPTALAVFDNSPTDSLRNMIENEGSEYLRNGRNVGFGAGHNIAIRHLRGRAPYHLILNPDVKFGPEVLAALYKFMEERSNVGAVMPQVLYPDGSVQRLCKLIPSPLDLALRRGGPAWIKSVFESRLRRYELEHVDLSVPHVVPTISGCFLLVRSSILERIGGFDERYFMYMEDVDLCRRIGEISDAAFFPGVSIYHEYDKGSYHSPLLRNYHLKSAFGYFSKWGWFIDPRRRRMNREKVRPL